MLALLVSPASLESHCCDAVYVSSEEGSPGWLAGQTASGSPVPSTKSPSHKLQSQSIPQAQERTVTRPILAWEVQGGSLAAIKHTCHLLSIGSRQRGMIC